jgi:hypothetical protein
MPNPSPLTDPAGDWDRGIDDFLVGADVDGDTQIELVIANNSDLWTGVLKWNEFFVALMGLVITLACMNLGNTLMARGANRRKELAIRVSVGASRSRLVRQMMSEGLLLSLLGGIAGSALASGLTVLNSRFRPPLMVPEEPTFSLDWHAGIFEFGLAIVCGATILGRKGNRLLRGSDARKQRPNNHSNKCMHVANVSLLCEKGLIAFAGIKPQGGDCNGVVATKLDYRPGRSRSTTSERSCSRSRTTSRPSGEMSKSRMSKSEVRLVNCRSEPESRSMSQRFLC